MWTYEQANGRLSQDAALVATGYSGMGQGKNNPSMQDVHAGCRWVDGKWQPVDGLTADDWGPLPKGKYTLNAPVDTKTHGPFVMWFTPAPDNQMYGRSAFGMNGDSVVHPGKASEGCTIFQRPIREQVWQSGDTALEVV